MTSRSIAAPMKFASTNALPAHFQWIVGSVLFVLLAATRGHHFADVQQLLPSASWAVFFLCGVYLRPLWAPSLLFVAASLLDFAAIGWGGISDYCVSPAYVALLPAYTGLWAAGRWYASRCRPAFSTLAVLAGAVLVGVAICEAISSGAFYFYSGRFLEPTLFEFGKRLVTYGSHSLASVGFWVAVAAVAHATLVANRETRTRSPSA